MAKRFTESEKWRDKWFRSLRPEYKLAWLYLLDNCDQAGVIEVDEDLANFQLGIATDWDSFLTHCDGRVERLENGKLWIVGFIDFQYGSISESCNAHAPVFRSIEKHCLKVRVSEGYLKGIQRVLDKDKDKDKDKVKVKVKAKEKGECEGEAWVVPDCLDTPEVRTALDEFAAMRRRIGKPIKSLANSSRTLKNFDSAEHLLYALDVCIANEYQGLKPDYRPSGRHGGGPKTFAQIRNENIDRACEEFVNG